MSKHNPRSRLRSILADPRCVTMATIFNPISTRFAKSLDYETKLIDDSIVSHTVLDAPDVIVLTLTELAEQVHHYTHVSQMPLIIDNDHDYGNALNVMHTMQKLDYTNAATIMIENTLLPRPFGTSDKPQLLPLNEALSKIKTTMLTRENSDILILGRTNATSISNLPNALRRLRAYKTTSVNALMIPKLRTRKKLETISENVRLPLMVENASTTL